MNKILKVVADDTFAFEHVEFSFSNGIWAINGENGKGKSSLFFLLAQGFFNKNPKSTDIDDINNCITGRPSVIEIEWFNTDSSVTYKVVNSRKAGKIEVWADETNISGKTIPQSLKIIEEKLGCNYVNFITQCFVDSTTTLDLVESSNDAPRKAFINKLLKFEELDAKLEVFKQRKKSLDSSIEADNRQLATLTSSVGELQEETEEDLKLEEELKAKVTAAETKLSSLREARAVLHSKFQATKDEIEAWTQCKTARDEISKLEAELSELETVITEVDQLDDLKESRKNYYSELNLLKINESEYVNKIRDCNNAIKNKTCPTCGHDINIKPFVKDLVVYQTTLNDILKSKGAVEESLNSINVDLKLYEKQQELSNKLDKLKVQSSSLTVDIKAITKKKEKLQEEGNTLNAEVSAKETELNEYRNAHRRVLESNQQAKTIREVNARVTANNEKLNRNIGELQTNIGQNERRLEVVKKWITILGPKGFRVHKMNKFLSQLNKAMKKYSDILSNGRIVSKFYVDEDGKIQFKVRDIDKALPFACWSSGEKARVKLSCLFAVLELLEDIGGSCFNILYLDEIGVTLDQEGKDNLFEVLAYLKSKAKCIYCISHTPLVNPVVFDGNFNMEKTDGISSILGA